MSPELKSFIRQNPEEDEPQAWIDLLKMFITDAVEAESFECIGEWAELAEEILQLCDEGKLK